MKRDVLKAVKRSSFVFPLACVAVVAMVLLSEAAYWRSVGSLDDLGKMGQARTTILGLSQNILDAESAQRGYLLTSRDEYLQPYGNALKRIGDSLDFLSGYYQQEQPRQLMGKLRSLTETKLSEMALTLRLTQEGKPEQMRELMLSGIGKEKMEAIRLLSADLLSLENANVAAGRQDVYATLLLSRIGVATLSIVSLFALFLYLRQSSAMEQQQDELKHMVQAERDRLEKEVILRTSQLTELAQHLQTAREDERSRLARDLHDELGALLTSAKLDAARIKSRLAATAPEARERLAHLVETLNSGIALKRRIIEDLRPSALSNLGLVATLEILAREHSDRSGVAVHTTLQAVQLEASAELVVYRLVQEAITNITKYAQARNIWLDLGLRDGRVHVSVRDDGIGFDTTAQRGSSAHGLMGMRFRVEAEGGSLAVSSSPGQGTEIQASLPPSTLRDAVV